MRVSLAGSNRELSCQVCVELTLIDYDCIHEVGLGAQVFDRWSYVLAPLVHVAHGSSRRQFQMLVDGVFRQAGPGDQMSVFDCL
jgi:hypothetical protein